MASNDDVIARLDAVVDDFVRRARYFNEPMTPGRAKTFVRQHRLNTRHRNSVLKLRVATNCPDWETRIGIISACSEEVIADHEFGGGKPHWLVLEELGALIGLTSAELEAATPLPTTEMAWAAWETLLGNRHWLEGIVGNTCAERANIPGYGDGPIRELGWFGYERVRWGELFGLDDDELVFFGLHKEADIIHSDRGWDAIGEHAQALGLEDVVVDACRRNLVVWEHYLEGIAAAGDALDAS